MKLSEYILNYRQRTGLTQRQLAEKCKLSHPMISYLETGKLGEKNPPTLLTLNKLAQGMNISIDRLFAEIDDMPVILRPTLPDNITPVPAMRQIPLIGEIACGEPILAQENINDLIDIPAHIKADFALKCKGDSMINARIFDGDIVYIRQQPIVEDGEIAAVRIDNEATLKRVRLFPDHIILSAENPTYKPLVYWNSEMDAVDIIGKAVAFTSPVN